LPHPVWGKNQTAESIIGAALLNDAYLVIGDDLGEVRVLDPANGNEIRALNTITPSNYGYKSGLKDACSSRYTVCTIRTLLLSPTI
jgi:hypothetical protein